MEGVSKLINNLNDRQKKAVVSKTKHILILAGAGSGKTKVLTHKVAYTILKREVNPENCLLLTFTNQAALEMKERMKTLLTDTNLKNKTGSGLIAGTFHSFCAKILRIDGRNIGIDNNFVIYDEQDQTDLIKEIITKLNLTNTIKPKNILYSISEAKNSNISPSLMKEISQSDFQRTVSLIFAKYEDELANNNAIDFDGLLLKSVELFEKNPEILHKWQNKFTHIFVDEWQDTNKVQYKLILLLTGSKSYLTVVGDAAQSIYSWRGADYRNINYLMKDYQDLEVINLEQNYRSTKTILDAANSVISKNTNHPILKLWTQKNGGEKINIYSARNGYDEANYVTEEIKNLRKKGLNYKDIAVLYRTNAQSRVLEEILIHASIPYVLVGGVRFYDRKEIKDLLCYLRLIVNPKDKVSLKRAEKIGKKRLEKFENIKNEIDLEKNTTLEILDKVTTATEYLSKFKEDDSEDAARLENIKELRSVALEFSNLSEFLENVALVQATDTSIEGDRVTLTTLHAAKGLEFSVVFIVGMEEGLFPHSRSLWKQEQMEEERRLAYVGITRAKERLYLSYASRRLYFGEKTNNPPSRFIYDIPEHLLQNLSGGTFLHEKGFFQENQDNGEIDLNFDDILDKYLK